MRKQCFRNLKKCKKITEKYVLEVCFTLIIIIYSGYPLHRSVFQWGPAKIMYNTVTIQYNAIRLYAIRLVSFNAVFYS